MEAWKIRLVLSCIILLSCLGCSDKAPSYYGLALEDDRDNPTVLITSPQNNAYYESPNTIPLTYSAEDISGIQSVEFYINDKKEYTLTGSNLTGKFNWYWQNINGITDRAKLQLRAVDGLGKESWSNIVMIYFDYTYFPMVDMSTYSLHADWYTGDPQMKISGNNSVWFLLGNGNLLQYKDSSFQEYVLPAEPSTAYGSTFVYDYFVNQYDQKYLVYCLGGAEHYYLKYQNAGSWIRTGELGAFHDFIEDRNGVAYAVWKETIVRFNGQVIDTVFKYVQSTTIGFTSQNLLYSLFWDGNVAQIISGTYQILATDRTSSRVRTKMSFDSLNNFYISAGIYLYKNSTQYSIPSNLLDIDTQCGVVSENEIWFATTTGLVLYKYGHWKVYNSLNSNLKNYNHSTIVVDNKDIVYVCYGDIKKLIVIRK